MKSLLVAMRRRIGSLLEWLLPIRVSVTFPSIKVRAARVEWRYFRRGSLKNLDSLGYSRLVELPSSDALEAYYTDEYWGSYRPKEGRSVNSRDLVHFDIIRSHLTGTGVFLNFGAGHGGISHLVDAQNGWEVFEVEPSSEGTVGQITTFKTLKKLPNLNFDVIYSSHSLEHVSDLKETLSGLLAISSQNTIFFFEVPDGELDAKAGRPVAPHTYYFKEQFFELIFTERIDCRDTRLQEDAIRVMGKGLNRKFIESLD